MPDIPYRGHLLFVLFCRHGIQDFKETDYFRLPDASMDHPPFFVHIPVPPPVTIDLTDDADAPEHEVVGLDD